MFSNDDKASSAAKAVQAPPSLISEDLRIEGDLIGDGDIQIDGKVQGDVRSRTLAVGERGAIIGAVYAETVLIRGSITGQIEAQLVTLTKTARVAGDVLHESLKIEPGAHLEGHCCRLNRPSSEGDGTINLVVNEGASTGPKPTFP